MSQQVLPEASEACQHLNNNIGMQVFFGRLANYGHVPQTEKQAQELLTLAETLRGVDAAVEKQAAEQSPFAGPIADLNTVLQNQGGAYVKQARAQEAELAIKSAAAQLAEDPMTYNSVLALKALEAQQVAAW